MSSPWTAKLRRGERARCGSGQSRARGHGGSRETELAGCACMCACVRTFVCACLSVRMCVHVCECMSVCVRACVAIPSFTWSVEMTWLVSQLGTLLFSDEEPRGHAAVSGSVRQVTPQWRGEAGAPVPRGFAAQAAYPTPCWGGRGMRGLKLTVFLQAGATGAQWGHRATTCSESQ